MDENKKSLVKSSNALTRFSPNVRRELVVRGLNAITEARGADFYFFKGEEYRLQGQLKQAISCYEKALHIDSEHENSLYWMGLCYLTDVEDRKGDDLELDYTIRNKRAISAFQKLIDIRKNKDNIRSCDNVYNHLGTAQHYLGLHEEAIKSYERAIELNPDNDLYYYNFGVALDGLGLYEG